MDWFKPCGVNSCDEPVYSLTEAKEKFEVREIFPDCWLVLNWDDDLDRFWLKFGVFDFFQSQIDGSNLKMGLIFHGAGTTNGLRECRHTYWGHEGYIFYPKGKLIAVAFKALSEFFDDMDPELSRNGEK